MIQLAAPCDWTGSSGTPTDAGVPASWTDGSNLQEWKTKPNQPGQFWGLAVKTDTTCSPHLASWQNLGMPDAQQNDQAATCAGESDHKAPIFCAQNADAWKTMLQ